MKKLNPLIIASTVLGLALISSVYLVVSQQREYLRQEQSLRNRYESCLSEAESWYSQNVVMLPKFCEQENLSDAECNKLLQSTINGRDKRRSECDTTFN